MIAILSKRDMELSTEQVLDWLEVLEADFVRINGRDILQSFSYSLNNERITNKLMPSDVNICWFRRWSDEDHLPDLVMKGDCSESNLITLYSHLKGEAAVINKSIFASLKNKKWLSSQSEISLSKIEMLQAAVESGLKTPKTLITTSKLELCEFFKENEEKVISKCISDGPFFYSNEEFLSLKTVQVNQELIDQLPAQFFVSLFQEMVDKTYELRVFYLDGKFYPMAIFSQLDDQTAVDFRNYNLGKPNRTVPYNLPMEIELKLQKLMNNLKMTTGSIDMIRSTSGEYIFLEVNPVGQFGMTSSPCNYFLEKKIAQYLIANDN